MGESAEEKRGGMEGEHKIGKRLGGGKKTGGGLLGVPIFVVPLFHFVSWDSLCLEAVSLEPLFSPALIKGRCMFSCLAEKETRKTPFYSQWLFNARFLSSSND